MKTALFSAAVLALVGSAWAQDGMKATTVMPEALTWKDNPAIPKGGQIAILVGDPTKACESAPVRDPTLEPILLNYSMA